MGWRTTSKDLLQAATICLCMSSVTTWMLAEAPLHMWNKLAGLAGGCDPGKQQELTAFACCLASSAKEKSSSCISSGFLTSAARQEEPSCSLRCRETLDRIQCHWARKKHSPDTGRRFQLLFLTLLCTEEMHCRGGSLSSVVILLPHKNLRLVSPINSSLPVFF